MRPDPMASPMPKSPKIPLPGGTRGSNRMLRTQAKMDNLNRMLQRRIRPNNELKVRPPRCCTQESVTIPLAAGAKFAQSLALATPQH